MGGGPVLVVKTTKILIVAIPNIKLKIFIYNMCFLRKSGNQFMFTFIKTLKLFPYIPQRQGCIVLSSYSVHMTATFGSILNSQKNLRDCLVSLWSTKIKSDKSHIYIHNKLHITYLIHELIFTRSINPQLSDGFMKL